MTLNNYRNFFKTRPNSMSEKTIEMMIIPGKRESQGYPKNIPIYDSRIMPPRLGAGGATPKPRKLNPASINMAVEKLAAEITITGPQILGKI